jgi:ribosomal protein S18 acetylase RimI-like enzyme
MTTSTNCDHTTPTSDSLSHRVAITSDCESLATLVNNSYRSEVSHQGWTNENDIILGARTNKDSLFDMIDSGKYVFLVFFGEVDQILKGCVYLQHQPETKSALLGMFAVRPDLQARGYGKHILSVTENYAISNWNVDYIEMRVLSQRSELIAYYNRRGYNETGQRRPFRQQHMTLGTILLRDNLELCTLIKCVKSDEKKTI